METPMDGALVHLELEYINICLNKEMTTLLRVIVTLLSLRPFGNLFKWNKQTKKQTFLMWPLICVRFAHSGFLSTKYQHGVKFTSNTKVLNKWNKNVLHKIP